MKRHQKFNLALRIMFCIFTSIGSGATAFGTLIHTIEGDYTTAAVFFFIASITLSIAWETTRETKETFKKLKEAESGYY